MKEVDASTRHRVQYKLAPPFMNFCHLCSGSLFRNLTTAYCIPSNLQLDLSGIYCWRHFILEPIQHSLSLSFIWLILFCKLCTSGFFRTSQYIYPVEDCEVYSEFHMIWYVDSLFNCIQVSFSIYYITRQRAHFVLKNRPTITKLNRSHRHPLTYTNLPISTLPRSHIHLLNSISFPIAALTPNGAHTWWFRDTLSTRVDSAGWVSHQCGQLYNNNNYTYI